LVGSFKIDADGWSESSVRAFPAAVPRAALPAPANGSLRRAA